MTRQGVLWTSTYDPEAPEPLGHRKVVGLLLSATGCTLGEMLATSGIGFPITNMLPCGEVYEYATIDDLPTSTTACRCGDPDHLEVEIT